MTSPIKHSICFQLYWRSTNTYHTARHLIGPRKLDHLWPTDPLSAFDNESFYKPSAAMWTGRTSAMQQTQNPFAENEKAFSSICSALLLLCVLLHPWNSMLHSPAMGNSLKYLVTSSYGGGGGGRETLLVIWRKCWLLALLFWVLRERSHLTPLLQSLK